MSETLPPPQMSIVEKLEAFGHQTLTAIEHAAVWLVGTVASSEQSLKTLEASSPLVTEALDAGIASANAHGIPLGELENAGGEILAAAHQFAAGLSQPAPKAAA